MRVPDVRGLMLAASGLFLTVSCGGGGGGSAPGQGTPPAQNAAVGGLWLGQLGTGGEIIGFVAETGEFHFLGPEGEQYFGTVTSSVNSISAQFTGHALLNTTFLDGATTGTGTLTGTIAERSTMNGTTTFRTSAGTQSNDTISLTYDALYDRDSSLATVAGTFRDLLTGAIVSIDANGTVFMQDPVSACVLNGTISIIDARFNVYRVQYTFSSCVALQFRPLNGVAMRGLATLDNTASPEGLAILVQGQAGGLGIAFLNVFERV